MYGDRYKDLQPLNDVERTDILRAEIGYALADDTLGLGRFREKYAAKMAQTPDARAFEIVSAPLGTSGDEFGADRPCRGFGRHARQFPARHEGALSGVGRSLAAGALPPAGAKPAPPGPASRRSRRKPGRPRPIRTRGAAGARRRAHRATLKTAGPHKQTRRAFRASLLFQH